MCSEACASTSDRKDALALASTHELHPLADQLVPQLLCQEAADLDDTQPALFDELELPDEDELGYDAPSQDSVLASSLLAALEITKHGEVRLRQDATYAPIWMRQVAEAAGLSETGEAVEHG